MTETRSLVYDSANPTYHVHAEVEPSDADDKRVDWKSSDTSIATLTPDATGEKINLTGKPGLFNLSATAVLNPAASDTVACKVGILDWKTLGFDTDSDVLTYTTHGKANGKIELDDATLTRTYPKILHVEPNTEYFVTLDMRLTGVEPTDGWRGIGVMFDVAGWVNKVWHVKPGGWQTYTGVIKTGGNITAQDVDVWINSTDTNTGNVYQMRNLGIVQIGAENGATIV